MLLGAATYAVQGVVQVGWWILKMGVGWVWHVETDEERILKKEDLILERLETMKTEIDEIKQMKQQPTDYENKIINK